MEYRKLLQLLQRSGVSYTRPLYLNIQLILNYSDWRQCLLMLVQKGRQKGVMFQSEELQPDDFMGRLEAFGYSNTEAKLFVANIQPAQEKARRRGLLKS